MVFLTFLYVIRIGRHTKYKEGKCGVLVPINIMRRKMINPMISVIMPVINPGKHISEAIDSVLAQSCQNWELLLIIDCPKDEMFFFLEQYSDPRIIKVYNETPRGIVCLKNQGLELAKGKYIVLFNSKDVMFPDMLMLQSDYLDRHEEIGAVAGQTVFMDEQRNRININNSVYVHPEEIMTHLFFHNVLVYGSVMIRTSCVRQNSLCYQEDCFGLEDFDFWVRLSERTMITHINSDVLMCRVDLDNKLISKERILSERKKLKYAEIQIRSLEKIGFMLSGEDKAVILDTLGEDQSKNYSIAEFQAVRSLLYNLILQAEQNNKTWRLAFREICHKIEDYIYKRTDIRLIEPNQIQEKSLPKAGYDFYLRRLGGCIDEETFLKNNDPYIIKQRLGLEYVLETEGVVSYHTDAAVFVHLYYVDLMEECFSYLKEACRVCEVYISTSVGVIAEYIDNECKKNNIKNCKVEVIDNRGQDIAALLLHHAKIMKQYQYVCFVHDKKSNHIARENGYLWFRDLWDNTLASSGYIANILREFECDGCLGMLSVPEPFWGEFISIIENGWESSFCDTDMLAERLNLTCRPIRCYPPIAIGTAFWAKTDAILPVLNEVFTTGEFPEDGVGSLSYAVERIFPYAVQSRGYYTGIAETKSFCVFKISYLQNLVMRTEKLLRRRFNIRKEIELEELQMLYDKVETFLGRFVHVYVYGTGKWANQLLKVYPQLVHLIDGFVETEPDYPDAMFCGKRILSANSVIQKETGFILAMAENKASEVYSYLLRNGVQPAQMLLFPSMPIFVRLN